jgi:hypothetical protein
MQIHRIFICQKRRLARYKTHLRALANKKVSRKRKKQYLKQKGGGFLDDLLSAAVDTVGDLVG